MASDEVSKPSPVPPYPEMILAAIEALDEKGGSNKSSIANYIESEYGEQLPESHVSLLSSHLQKMKDGGELVMAKNNYMKADPNTPAPPKRGRGRPPKPKPDGPPGVEAPSSPRPRGRPPKAAAASGGLSRPRGRPPKKAKTAGDSEGPEAAAPASAAAATPLSGVKRGRGRPPKVKPAFADVGFA